MQLYFLYWIVQHFHCRYTLFKYFGFYSLAMKNLLTASAQKTTPASSGNGAIPKKKVSILSGQYKYNT
jgi:hypothetical protein